MPTVTRSVKESVNEDWDGCCHWCGVALEGFYADYIRYDHVIPLALGGKTAAENIVIACMHCNAEKSSLTVAAWRAKRLAHGLPWPSEWAEDYWRDEVECVASELQEFSTEAWHAAALAELERRRSHKSYGLSSGVYWIVKCRLLQRWKGSQSPEYIAHREGDF